MGGGRGVGGGCIMPKSRNCHYDIPRPLTIKTYKTKKSLIVLWLYAPNLLVRHEELDWKKAPLQ